MSSYSVMFHAGTANDYNEAYYWYEEQQKGLGEKFLAAISSRIRQILDNPDTFSVKLKQGYHEALVKRFPYTIVYRIYKKGQSNIHHFYSSSKETSEGKIS